jgi:hypothetical protein
VGILFFFHYLHERIIVRIRDTIGEHERTKGEQHERTKRGFKKTKREQHERIL